MKADHRHHPGFPWVAIELDQPFYELGVCHMGSKCGLVTMVTSVTGTPPELVRTTSREWRDPTAIERAFIGPLSKYE